jgi:hypothetical protein
LIRSFFSRWRPRHLLLAWCAYWVGLALVKLGPVIIAAWRLSRRTEHGNAGVSFSNGTISGHITDAGQTLWAGSMSFTHLTLLVTIPPLLLWIVWFVTSSRTNNAGEIGLNKQTGQRELSATEPRIGIIDTSSSSTSKRRAREES